MFCESTLCINAAVLCSAVQNVPGEVKGMKGGICLTECGLWTIRFNHFPMCVCVCVCAHCFPQCVCLCVSVCFCLCQCIYHTSCLPLPRYFFQANVLMHMEGVEEHFVAIMDVYIRSFMQPDMTLCVYVFVSKQCCAHSCSVYVCHLDLSAAPCACSLYTPNNVPHKLPRIRSCSCRLALKLQGVNKDTL